MSTIEVGLPEKRHNAVDGFRWRSHEITRIEGFSDAVFGFAVTLLVVSLEVPRTSTELLGTMRGFGAFVVTFLILAGMWYKQHEFFRRYGLEDRVTVVLNLALLFTVLFFVYPLKFLFTNFFINPRMKGTITTAHGIELIVLPVLMAAMLRARNERRRVTREWKSRQSMQAGHEQP